MAAWDPSGVVQGVTDAANFIPELWSDEVVAAYKASLVVAGLVTNFNHVGKKGDTLHLPAPGRLTAADKSEGTSVTPSQDTAGVVDVLLDKHKYVSMVIEDIARVQALDSMRNFYTDDMGYAIATAIDTDLMNLYSGFQGGVEVIGSDGTTAWSPAGSGNGQALTDPAIRNMMQTLDDANIPQSDRYLIIPPTTKNTLLGLSRFTEQAFVGEGGAANSIRNGRIGDIYGMGVYVTTNCPTITNTSGTTSYRVGMMIHKSAIALVTQLSVRMQSEYKTEYLGYHTIADSIYGVKELRDDGGVAFVVPA